MNSISDMRVAIYDAVVRSGRAPNPAQLAAILGLSEEDVAAAYRALADAHVIVLRPGTLEIAWAPPFSLMPTGFQAAAGGMSWYAPCAWDAFGIPAALHRDAAIDARCAWSGETIACGVADGRAYGDGVIHLLVPAAHFWDDIAYT
jgi:DNA-binding transcriptional MocR family regulator